MIKNVFRYSVLSFCFGILSLSLNAQISLDGQPYSFSKKLELPKFLASDPSEMQYIDSTGSKDCNALEFARFLPLRSQLGDEDWVITSLENGDKIYCMGIE